jgi:hypothetical protein
MRTAHNERRIWVQQKEGQGADFCAEQFPPRVFRRSLVTGVKVITL